MKDKKETFLDRLIKERDELKNRLTKLNAFLLRGDSISMGGYLDALEARLSDFRL